MCSYRNASEGCLRDSDALPRGLRAKGSYSRVTHSARGYEQRFRAVMTIRRTQEPSDGGCAY